MSPLMGISAFNESVRRRHEKQEEKSMHKEKWIFKIVNKDKEKLENETGIDKIVFTHLGAI